MHEHLLRSLYFDIMLTISTQITLLVSIAKNFDVPKFIILSTFVG